MHCLGVCMYVRECMYAQYMLVSIGLYYASVSDL